MGDQGYAGDLNPSEAWQLLEREADAVLLDVRTEAEWQFVGLPDLSGLNKQVGCICWQSYPDMQIDPDFVDKLVAGGLRPEQPVLFICRSGQRSRSAAIALTQAGFQRCYNVAEGFEGGLDAERHRGAAGGWKARGLPWFQS